MGRIDLTTASAERHRRRSPGQGHNPCEIWVHTAGSGRLVPNMDEERLHEPYNSSAAAFNLARERFCVDASFCRSRLRHLKG